MGLFPANWQNSAKLCWGITWEENSYLFQVRVQIDNLNVVDFICGRSLWCFLSIFGTYLVLKHPKKL